MDEPLQIGSLRGLTRAVSCSPGVPAVIRTVAALSNPVVLDSARSDLAGGRYTIVACDPLEVFEASASTGDPFEAMRQRLARTGMLAPADGGTPARFPGGWIGYFAYEAGRFIERLPATTIPDIGLPLARFGLYDAAAILDHQTGRWSVAAIDFPGSEASPTDRSLPSGLSPRLDRWEELLAAAAQATAAPPEPEMQFGSPTGNLSESRFLQMVERAREYIAAGDIFQVNLARRETVRVDGPTVELYLRLRETNPGAYSAFLSWEPPPEDAVTPPRERRSAILSSSPELFLEVNGRDVVTRPIKGTRPRSTDPAVDQALRHELAVSAKDRAELAMIVDLERNDLGRVCAYGSIRVHTEPSAAAPYAMETHPTVHHLVATVTGRLAQDRDGVDLLRATFPGGSITGAPKVRAMQIIDELEPNERSVYTGAIGYFAPGGRMTMNIAIRTMIQARGRLHWYAGGGIVADSVPAMEYEETCAKALGMRRALGMVEAQPASRAGW